jgi:hypothetical protein
MPVESHKEFVARMDRARAANNAEANRGTLVGLLLYAVLGAGYLFVSDKGISWLAVVLIFMDSLLLMFLTWLLVPVYKSRRL